jgi:hypothetical protein
VIKLWKRIPRGWKIVLDCAAVLILLAILWAVLDYPMPTANMAFRRAVSGAGFPARNPELILELPYDEVEYGRLETTGRTLGLLAEGDHVLLVSLSKKPGWHGWDPLWVPAAEGVYYTPLPGWGDRYSVTTDYNRKKFFDAAKGIYGEEGPCELRIPAFAVKAPGADAALTLILYYKEEYDSTDWSEARFPLLLQEQEKGWFIFRWDSLDIINHLSEDMDEFTEDCYWVLNLWMTYYDMEDEYHDVNAYVNAKLELTTRDEAGKVLNQVTWELP